MITIPFSSSFISKYSSSFDELLRLGTLAAQRKKAGKESAPQDETASRILLVLLALSKPGLSLDDIESLEYCLRSLNQSLVIPTVQSLFPFQFLPKKLMVSTGKYFLSGSDVTLIYSPRIRATLAMGVGSFALTGQNVNLTAVLHNNYILSMGVGSFALSGQALVTNLSLATQTIQVYLETEAFGSQFFRGDFSNGVDPHKQITVVGSGNLGSDTIHYGSTILVTVIKTTNGGIAQDTGQIVFSKNGVDEAGSGAIGGGTGTQTFSIGDNLAAGNIQYSYTGLSANDVLRVTITEG